MRTIMLGVPALLALAVLSLAASRPQDPKVVREPIKYGDRMSRWIGKHFKLTPDRAVAFEWGEGEAEFTLVAVGVDYAEFESRQQMRTMVPLAVLRFECGTPPK
jgi:hypothetical protein